MGEEGSPKYVPLFFKDLKDGDEIEVDGIVIEVVEVNRYRDAEGRWKVFVSYRVREGERTSPVAHLWGNFYDDARPILRKIRDHYLDLKRRGIL